MRKAFQYLVLATVVAHCAAVLIPGRGNLAEVVLVTSSSLLIGLGLIKFIPLARFVYLLSVMGFVLIIAAQSELVFLVGHAATDQGVIPPKTGPVANFLLLLDGAVLLISYVTPVAYEFEAFQALDRPNTRSIKSTIVRSDGAMLACLTVILLVVQVGNQFAVRQKHLENLPSAKIDRAIERLETAIALGEKVEIGNAYLHFVATYSLLGHSDETVLMYEKVLALRDAGVDVPLGNLHDLRSELAYLYSTQSNTQFGDGSRVLEMAERFSFLDDDHRFLTALATVHARDRP